MRKLCFLLLATCPGLLSAASAWEVGETCLETLAVTGQIAFTSSSCDCVDGDIITAQVTSANSAVLTGNSISAKTSLHPKTNQSSG